MSQTNVHWINDPRIETILKALEGLEYGSLQITVHESQITQIDRTEKKRFPLERMQSSKQTSLTRRNHK
jgi:hypothetical protein